ncbi:nitroreductase [Ramlibacter henchirensis]|uniref:Nitroreductase n=1 Tax=Ramlibacter henchirensis TaxID=204072 RepID=A0A4Z0BX79_9BURK|nr:nitroreductase family protein [Ramlibacter henchirensis]TFZ02878.1 nitroreductase [Ramlibacter henchirensis]
MNDNGPSSSVRDAVRSRQSVRAFLGDAVPTETLREVLQDAARAPSGGNLQPWHVDVLTGERLVALKTLMQARLASDAEPETPEYDIYPPSLPAPWRDRRFRVGEGMYALLKIPREDKAARRRWFANNYTFFGAPAAMICSVDRLMGPPQWSDLGMFLQTVMLLLRERGLDSCAQESWSIYPQTISRFLAWPESRMVFCGMAIGWRDPAHPVNALVTERAPLDEWARFHST